LENGNWRGEDKNMTTLLFLLGFTIFVGVVFFCIMGVE
jgi:hypothetical protein